MVIEHREGPTPQLTLTLKSKNLENDEDFILLTNQYQYVVIFLYFSLENVCATLSIFNLYFL